MHFSADLIQLAKDTLRDALPIAIILTTFQVFVLGRALPHPRRLLMGFAYVLMGLTLFLAGLEQALFPLGRTMAAQLVSPEFVGAAGHTTAAVGQTTAAAGQTTAAVGQTTAAVGEGETLARVDARAYLWVYVFAFAIGFSTTIAEPALIAVAIKADELSAGAIGAWGLRIAVALGVAFGITLGAFRIVIGAPIHYFIIGGYVIVVIQTLFAPKLIVPLAFDSGGVTTSTVTVPLVAALGLGLAETVPGRSPLIDGFGLIAFASLFPMMSVMAYAQASEWHAARNRSARDPDDIVDSQGDSP